MRGHVGVVAIGLGFGFALSRTGFSSWDEVHRMFTFADLRLLLTFMTAVTLLAVGWAVIGRLSAPRWTTRPVHPGSLVGGLLFGAGWALTGACPSIALVQLGEGQLGALLTIAGIFAGNWLYSVVHERYFRWSSAGCSDG